MRKAAFKINDNWQEGHWHESPVTEGQLYQGRKGWSVVEKVFDGKFNPGEGESDGYFCKIRPATQAEIDAHLERSLSVSANEEDIWEKIAYIGS